MCLLQGKGAGLSIRGLSGLILSVIGAVFIALPQIVGAHNANAALGIGVGIIGPISLAVAACKLLRIPLDANCSFFESVPRPLQDCNTAFGCMHLFSAALLPALQYTTST